MGIKHTPGPWVVGASDFLDQWVCIDAPSGDPDLDYKSWEGIAMAYGCEESPSKGLKKANANARLIAAAPELLVALIEVTATLAWNAHGECRAIHDGPIMPSSQAIEVARAAIAKAKGEEQ